MHREGVKRVANCVFAVILPAYNITLSVLLDESRQGEVKEEEGITS